MHRCRSEGELLARRDAPPAFLPELHLAGQQHHLVRHKRLIGLVADHGICRQGGRAVFFDLQGVLGFPGHALRQVGQDTLARGNQLDVHHPAAATLGWGQLRQQKLPLLDPEIRAVLILHHQVSGADQRDLRRSLTRMSVRLQDAARPPQGHLGSVEKGAPEGTPLHRRDRCSSHPLTQGWHDRYLALGPSLLRIDRSSPQRSAWYTKSRPRPV